MSIYASQSKNSLRILFWKQSLIFLIVKRCYGFIHSSCKGSAKSVFRLLALLLADLLVTIVSPSSCAESSDDSYISAGEDPLEAPIFEIPIHDAIVIAGTEVLFKCIVTGNPSPQGKCIGYHTQEQIMNLWRLEEYLLLAL